MRVYLVRHGSHALLGRVLCGRIADIGLDATGHRQASALAAHFAGLNIDLVQSSVRRRARETAQPIAERSGRALEIVPALDEHDAGAWSGCTFEALARDARWDIWNKRRGSSRPPGGESMWELQQRIVGHLEALRDGRVGTAVIVSHAEPIRAAMMHYRGIALDDFHQVDVEPAGISVLELDPGRFELSSMVVA